MTNNNKTNKANYITKNKVTKNSTITPAKATPAVSTQGAAETVRSIMKQGSSGITSTPQTQKRPISKKTEALTPIIKTNNTRQVSPAPSRPKTSTAMTRLDASKSPQPRQSGA